MDEENKIHQWITTCHGIIPDKHGHELRSERINSMQASKNFNSAIINDSCHNSKAESYWPLAAWANLQGVHSVIIITNALLTDILKVQKNIL